MFSFKNLVLGLFLFLTVLYYFLRYQWGWDIYVVAFQVLMLVTLSTIGLIFSIQRLHKISQQDTVYMIVVLYSMLLLILSCFRGGMPALMYGTKDYVLPIMLLISYKLLVSYDNRRIVYYIVALLGFSVSLIYIFEFINKFVLLKGYFTYTEGIRTLMAEKGFTGIAETSFDLGEIKFFRMPGPLSHSSSTGIIIAVGLLASLPLQRKRFDPIPQLIILVSFLSLVLSGARTAWISCLIGYFYYRHQNLRYIIIALLYFAAVILVFSIYNPAIVELVNISRFFNTLGDILQKAEVLELNKIYNIMIGSGFNYPGMSANEELIFRPILEDDFFALQLFTMYGVLPVMFFVYYLLKKRKGIVKHVYKDKYWMAGKAILICFLVSTFHTNALVRPQLLPIFVLFIVIVDQISNVYKKPKSHIGIK